MRLLSRVSAFFLLHSLAFYILTNYFNRCASGCQQTKALTPEGFLPQLLPYLRIFLFQQSTACALISIYEAAEMDGANIFQKIRYITLPELKSTIIIMTLMSIGGIFRGDFSMFYQLVGNNGLLFNATDVIDTFAFRSLMTAQEFGMSAAVGLYQSVLCFILIMITNRTVKKIDPDSALF